MVNMKQQQQQQQDYRSSSQDYDHYLRSVQQPSKIAKKPLPLAGGAASSGAPQPKVYKVKPIHFRELVQQLTGARTQPQQQQQQQQQQQPRPPQARARRTNLHAVAPPPLRNLPAVHPHQLQFYSQSETTSNALDEQVQCKVEEKEFISFDKVHNNNNNNNGVGTTELVLSPNFQAWFSFAMMSPKPATVSQV